MDIEKIIVPVALFILSAIITVSIPVVGWAFKSVHEKIDAHKKDSDLKIAKVESDAEVKRLETRDTLLELVEAKFGAIWGALKDIKDEVKRHYDK